MSQQKQPEQRRQSLGSVIRSVSASMFGVQSSKKHAEDFAHGSAGSPGEGRAAFDRRSDRHHCVYPGGVGGGETGGVCRHAFLKRRLG